MFLLIFFMWPFAGAMEVGRCFMISNVRLGQMAKWPFLMAWSKVFFNGLKRAVWYHLDSSGLILSARALSAAGCCWIGDLMGLMVRLN